MSELGQKLIEIVRRKAAENPGFTYTSPIPDSTSCWYVHDGKPSCLIGQALWEAGLIDDTIDEDDNSSSFRHLLRYKGGVHSWHVEHDEANWLALAQSWQDKKYPWGHAVQQADAGIYP